MSRKNKSILAKKAKRKDRRKTKRALKKMENAGKNKANSDGRNVVGKDPQQIWVNKVLNGLDACNYYDIPEDIIRSWYDRIRNKLNEDATKRVYHNWSCMLAPKRVELENAKPHIVLAAFFQYYEFDLERSCAQDNCKIFKEFCQDGMIEDENMKQLVCCLLGEKTGQAVSGDIEYDTAFLQDLDLLILASTADIYKKYAELSRQEWSTSGKTNFDMLRRKTLTTLLALDIYQTPEFSNKYAKIARANIEQELIDLEKR